MESFDSGALRRLLCPNWTTQWRPDEQEEDSQRPRGDARIHRASVDPGGILRAGNVTLSRLRSTTCDCEVFHIGGKSLACEAKSKLYDTWPGAGVVVANRLSVDEVPK